ncbi:MAG: MBL fold metallo-hydrolase [Bacteriovoracaceae bacterium]|nr:MBL fold metallo-hydrolase [Bacteriovoracaceae bacterium]
MSQDIIFHQLFERETSSYTYLLGDPKTKEAIIIDPVVEMVDRDLKLIDELGLKLKYVLDTHVHADHVTGSGEIRKRRQGVQVCLSSTYQTPCPDVHLNDGQELEFGSIKVKAFSTPGHTEGCMSYLIGNKIFTGDALLNRGCGRTDFQGGSANKLFESVRGKLFELPEETVVYPAHDYKGLSKSSIEIEKKFNPRLNLDIQKEEFINIMDNLNLPDPKKIHEAVPANMLCGMPSKSEHMDTQFVHGVPTVSASEVSKKLGHLKVIDVRTKEEFNNELGHVPASLLATLGDELDVALEQVDKSEEVVFVCRSGMRSANATIMALEKGFSKVYNMEGGMIRWNELNLSVEKDMGGS